MEKILPTCQGFLSEHPDIVSLGPPSAFASSADDLCRQAALGRIHASMWRDPPLHPQRASDAGVDWVFTADVLNFSFWNDDESRPFAVRWGGATHTGYWALCACLRRAEDEGVPVTSAEFQRTCSEEALRRVFRSDGLAGTTEIPLFLPRLAALREGGAALCSRFGGSLRGLLLEADGSARRAIALLLEHFPSFRDVHDGVHLLKRAQILIADLWGLFEGRGWGRFEDIDELTMFADYRVPQALAHRRLLNYSPALKARLKGGEMLRSGETAEVALRAASIVAVERLKRAIADAGRWPKEVPMNAVIIDFFLWNDAKERKEEMQHIPIHRTRSIYY